jgi:hypothetical protein
MRRYIIWLVLMVWAIPVRAGDDRPPPLARALWTAGAAVTFATFDYVAVGLARPNHEGVYKIVQYAVQAGITYFLYKKCGLSSAIGFNIIWWSYGADMLYYGLCELRGQGATGGGRWPHAGAWENDTDGGDRFVGWTPVGLLRGAQRVRDHPVPQDTVIAQALGGAVIGLGISIAF